MPDTGVHPLQRRPPPPAALGRAAAQLTLLVLAVLLVGCALQRSARLLPGTRVALPPGVEAVSHITGLSDGSLLLQAHDDTLWLRRSPKTEWQPLRLPPPDALCQPTFTVLGDGLPDHRVQLARLCFGRFRDAWGVYDHQHHALAFDLHRGTLTALYPWSARHLGATSWHPDMRRAVVMTDPGFSTLYWLEDDTLAPWEVTLADGDQTWFLPDSVPALAASYTDPTYDMLRTLHAVGEINGAVWSPTGDRIAVWATLEPIGRPGPSPLTRRRWTLYLIDPATRHAEAVLRRVPDAGGGAWSPDGEYFMAGSDRGPRVPGGLWMLSVADRTVVPIADGIFGAIVWSPDGTMVTVTKSRDTTSTVTEVWSYDLRPLLPTQPPE